MLEAAPDLPSALHVLIQDTIRSHKRIIFNGNGYDDAWIEEAEQRGLLNLRTTPDALPYFIRQENIELFKRHRIFDEEEVRSRYEIFMEEYGKTLHIEALTMLDMVKKQILPAVTAQVHEWLDTAAMKQQLLDVKSCYESKSAALASDLQEAAFAASEKLKRVVQKAEKLDVESAAFCYRDEVLPLMDEVRTACDALETMTSPQYWPFPTYGKLLFGIQ